MRIYLANKFDLSFTKLTLDINKDQVGCFPNKYLYIDIPHPELYQIFRETPQPNLAVIEINLILNEFLSGSIWLIESVCKKYPNLKRLMINKKDPNCHDTMLNGFQAPSIPCCAPLNNLQHLVMFEIECDSIESSLQNVTIASLRQFKLECYQNYNLIDELRRFLGRHKKLVHLKLNLKQSRPTLTRSIEVQKQGFLNVLHFAIKNMKKLTWCYCLDHSLDQSQWEGLWNLIKEHHRDKFELNLENFFHHKVEITVNGIEILKKEHWGWLPMTF